MKTLKLAGLTIFALPLPLIAVMFSVHCHGAGFPIGDLADENARNVAVESPASRLSVAGGQSITSLMISPAALSAGQASTGTIAMRYRAPAGGLVIALHNTDRAHVSIPAQVVIPEGETSVSFHITTQAVKNLISLNLSASYQTAVASSTVTLLPTPKSQWFVSPAGKRAGNGTQNSPWDLATAFTHGPSHTEIRPGDTIWLRAGRYMGTYLSTLNGTETQPIIVRALPGERVIIDRNEVNEDKQPALKVKGSWVWFWGIEITNSSPNRQRNSPYTGRDQPWRGAGADVYAPHVKFINMIFHDNGQGIWDKQDMTEVHGCLFFYNGNNKREHGLYIGNRTGTKYITDNILFAQGGYGILAHSDSSASSQKGLHIEGNVSFNNGVITADDQKTGNLQVGGVDGEAAERIVIKNNFIYNTPTNAANKNNGIRLGYEDRSNQDVQILDNYVVSKSPLLLWWWQKADVKGNTIYSTGGDVLELKLPTGMDSSSYKWDFNTYFSSTTAEPSFAGDSQTLSFTRWRQSSRLDQHSQAQANRRPRGIDVFVRPNHYEAGRANIVVYNWDLMDRVAVDVSGLLRAGDYFEVRDAQNYFAEPVAKGAYKGGPLLLPMKLSHIATPIGNVERMPQHTSPEFGVFVIRKLSVGKTT